MFLSIKVKVNYIYTYICDVCNRLTNYQKMFSNFLLFFVSDATFKQHTEVVK